MTSPKWWDIRILVYILHQRQDGIWQYLSLQAIKILTIEYIFQLSSIQLMNCDIPSAAEMWALEYLGLSREKTRLLVNDVHAWRSGTKFTHPRRIVLNATLRDTLVSAWRCRSLQILIDLSFISSMLSFVRIFTLRFAWVCWYYSHTIEKSNRA